MRTFNPDQLVSVDGADGVVLETQGLTKVVVVTADGVFHTVHPKHVAGRDAEGPDDQHMRDLVHRARVQSDRAARGGSGSERSGHHGRMPHRHASR